MKKIILFLLFIFLTACANSVNPEPSSTVTFTPVSSSTFTQIPSTPTQTPDPLANTPDGATGVENGVYFMDADDGYRYFYQERDDSWVRQLIQDYYAYDHWDFNSLPTDVWVKDGVPGAEKIVKMTSSDSRSFKDRSDMLNIFDKFIPTRFGYSSVEEGRNVLKSESGIPVAFTFNGQKIVGNLGNNGGFSITFVSEEELKLLYDQGKAVRSNGNLGLVYLTYDGVENGKILIRVASSKSLDELLVNIPSGGPEYELRKMIFLPMINILITDENEDLINVSGMTYAGIQASRSADSNAQGGEQNLNIVIAP